MEFIKQLSDHTVAHLYEHLFFIHLDTALREKGLYPIVDYSIDAYTDDGQVTFDIENYRNTDFNQYILQATDEFLSIDEVLDVSLRELEAEYKSVILIKDREKMKETLRVINGAPWNAHSTLQIANEVIVLGENVSVHQLALSTSLSNVPTNLQPLYRLIAGITINAAVSDIADTFGGFVANEAFTINETKDLIGEVLLRKKIARAELLELVDETKLELQTSGAYERLIVDLADINEMVFAPSAEKTLEDTGILMNATKWNELATNESLQSILQRLSLDFNFANET